MKFKIKNTFQLKKVVKNENIPKKIRKFCEISPESILDDYLSHMLSRFRCTKWRIEKMEFMSMTKFDEK